MSIHTAVEMLKRRRTKIVATLGPASSSPEMIEQLIRAGANVFRLNMSHGDHPTHRQTFDHIRQVSDRLQLPIAVMADLSGPKIRTGKFEGGSIRLTEGESVTVTTRDVLGRPGLIPSQYQALANDVKPNDRILLADGLLELRVVSTDGSEISCTVVEGGLLGDRKGMNLPGVQVSAPSLTEKDQRDAAFALELGVDYLALSFVRRAADVQALRELMIRAGGSADIIAKIEKPEALEEIDGILELSDAIMVARGDLGVELLPEQVPIVQDELVALSRARNLPVIVATQMLESMIEHIRPTRAEVTDVSHAVHTGADAVMLSAETATGEHPVEAVGVMDRIARQTEAHMWRQGAFDSISSSTALDEAVMVHDAVARSTAQLSRDLKIRAIFVVSGSGTSARFVSSERPAAPVLAVTEEPTTYRRMALYWGVVPQMAKPGERLTEPIPIARSMVQQLGLASPGQHILLLRGFGTDPAQNNPSLTVLSV